MRGAQTAHTCILVRQSMIVEQEIGSPSCQAVQEGEWAVLKRGSLGFWDGV